MQPDHHRNCCSGTDAPSNSSCDFCNRFHYVLFHSPVTFSSFWSTNCYVVRVWMSVCDSHTKIWPLTRHKVRVCIPVKFWHALAGLPILHFWGLRRPIPGQPNRSPRFGRPMSLAGQRQQTKPTRSSSLGSQRPVWIASWHAWQPHIDDAGLYSWWGYLAIPLCGCDPNEAGPRGQTHSWGCLVPPLLCAQGRGRWSWHPPCSGWACPGTGGARRARGRPVSPLRQAGWGRARPAAVPGLAHGERRRGETNSLRKRERKLRIRIGWRTEERCDFLFERNKWFFSRVCQWHTLLL